VTAANTADIRELPHLLGAEDEVIFGDAGYASDGSKRGSRTGNPLGSAGQRQTRAPFECHAEKAQPAVFSVRLFLSGVG
jgi:hypothetical protein